jgi:hypothetical protein
MGLYRTLGIVAGRGELGNSSGDAASGACTSLKSAWDVKARLCSSMGIEFERWADVGLALWIKRAVGSYTFVSCIRLVAHGKRTLL